MTSSSGTETDAIYRLPDLRYDYGALEPHISGRIMELHHAKHNAAYVAAANRAVEKLQGCSRHERLQYSVDVGKNLAFNLSSHVVHSLFWKCLSPDGGGEPAGWTAEQIDANFGGFAPFRANMIGQHYPRLWALASWEPTGRDRADHDHQGNHGQGTVPILGIDAWEHATTRRTRTTRGRSSRWSGGSSTGREPRPASTLPALIDATPSR